MIELPDRAGCETRPLADRMRPSSLQEVVGQAHILGPGCPLTEALAAGHPHSMLFWGPPGTGKTTLAALVAESLRMRMERLSAVTAGVRIVRDLIERAQRELQQGQRTLLFIDEIHRFNKAQQDVLLPAVEAGILTFVGATTENPSFEVNRALLSRLRLYRLEALSTEALEQILERALKDKVLGLGTRELTMDAPVRRAIVKAADGDGRRLLNLLEIAATMAAKGRIDIRVVSRLAQRASLQFDKGGDLFYEQISALHKAVRGSAPDAALYWLARMLEGGCDPLYIARRVVRMASEDVGNADPRALQIAIAAWDAQQRLGSPEGELSIAQAVVFLASAPKSNSVYLAFAKARQRARESGSLEVPIHLRNAPTSLLKNLGYGTEYHYAHDYPDAYVPGEDYLPAPLSGERYYEPARAGLEIRIGERLARLRALDKNSSWRRYGSSDCTRSAR